jgi:hypothetical protein
VNAGPVSEGSSAAKIWADTVLAAEDGAPPKPVTVHLNTKQESTEEHCGKIILINFCLFHIREIRHLDQ